jgi:tetratricopeptide (TPR) repeat protein
MNNLKFRLMSQVLHRSEMRRRSAEPRRWMWCCTALLAVFLQDAHAQGYGMQQPGMQGPGGVRGGPPQETIQSDPVPEKPDKVAVKMYAGGMKYLGKAHEFEDQAGKAVDPDKRASLNDKAGDAYGRALDYFTEVLRNKPAMYDAWNKVGYIHFRLGAFRESLDDYNHALTLKPDLTEAIRYRGEANLNLDRLDEAKTAYLELFNHDRPQADELMTSMQKWLQNHRSAANGMRPGEIDGFDKWLQEREGAAKATASSGQ